MLFKIAWRNLWRNKRRSLIVLTSIIVGVAALLMNDSFGVGMINQMLKNPVQSHISHIQIHKAGFNDNKKIQDWVENPEKVESILKDSEFIENYSKRTIVFGLLSSANTSSGVSIVGVDPEKEKNITIIHKAVIEGEYLSGKKNEIVIGKKLADKLEVEIGDRVVTVAADAESDVASELFRIVGIFKTGSSDFDRSHIYIPISTARNMLRMGDNVSEFAIILKDAKDVQQNKAALSSLIDDENEILTYQELLPLIMTYIGMYDQMIIIFYVIIGIAVLFGIINTMLMSVFERVHEFGVLMSIGMRNIKIFIMVVQEAFVLGVFGSLIGLFLGLLIYLPLAYTGLDFSIFSESLNSFGLNHIIYPELNLQVVINCLLVMPIATVVGAIYPAIRAIKLQPTEAMRYT